MQTKVAERYFFFGLLLTTLIFTFLIFRPFWVVLVLGICFSIVLYPVFKWFNKKLSNWLASLLTVILFTIIVCGPLLAIGTIVFKQSQDVVQSVINNGGDQPFLDEVNININKVLPDGIAFDIKDKVAGFISYTSDNITKIFSTTLSAFFSFVLMLLIMFYFLKDGHKWEESILVISPLGDSNDEKIIRRLTLAVNGVIKGSLLIGLIQGVLLGFGLWIFHIPHPALWGLVAAVASLLPTIGTSLVSVPAIIFLFANGHSGLAIGLLAWAGLLVGTIDNFLGPLIVGGRLNIPPLLILFAVLGGVSLLGPVGIIVGPLTVSLLYTLISIYRNEYKNEQKNSAI
jgi:predicted PurR-regulated permease PerM